MPHRSSKSSAFKIVRFETGVTDLQAIIFKTGLNIAMRV